MPAEQVGRRSTNQTQAFCRLQTPQRAALLQAALGRLSRHSRRGSSWAAAGCIHRHSHQRSSSSRRSSNGSPHIVRSACKTPCAAGRPRRAGCARPSGFRTAAAGSAAWPHSAGEEGRGAGARFAQQSVNQLVSWQVQVCNMHGRLLRMLCSRQAGGAGRSGAAAGCAADCCSHTFPNSQELAALQAADHPHTCQLASSSTAQPTRVPSTRTHRDAARMDSLLHDVHLVQAAARLLFAALPPRRHVALGGMGRDAPKAGLHLPPQLAPAARGVVPAAAAAALGSGGVVPAAAAAALGSAGLGPAAAAAALNSGDVGPAAAAAAALVGAAPRLGACREGGRGGGAGYMLVRSW